MRVARSMAVTVAVTCSTAPPATVPVLVDLLTVMGFASSAASEAIGASARLLRKGRGRACGSSDLQRRESEAEA